MAIFQHIESTIKVVNSNPLRGCPNLQAVKVKCPDFNIVAFYWSPNTLLAEDLENVAKGDLISKQTSLWLKSPKIDARSTPLSTDYGRPMKRFLLKSQTFRFGQTIWAHKFCGICGIFNQLISTHF